MESITRANVAEQIDRMIYFCLILFSFTFYLDIPVNFITLAFCLGLIKMFLVKNKVDFTSRHIQFILLFVVLALPSVLFNNTGASLAQNISAYKATYISPVTGLFLACFFKFDKNKALTLLSCLALVLFVNACIAIVQAFYGISVENGRVIGAFNDKMLLAAVHMLILPILLSVIVFADEIPKLLRRFYLSAVILNIPAVVLSGTRIVWIGILISYMLILFIGIKNRLKAVLLLAGVIAAVFVLVNFNSYLQSRFDSITNVSLNKDNGYQSNYERIMMWERAWQMFKDHPAVGVGVGNFHDQIAMNYKMPPPLATPWHAHNVFLNVLAETGLIGIAGFFAMFIYLYYNTVKTWYRKRNVISAAYFFCMLTYNINFLTDVLFCGHYLKTPTYIFWLITGIYLSLNKYINIQTRNNNIPNCLK